MGSMMCFSGYVFLSSFSFSLVLWRIRFSLSLQWLAVTEYSAAPRPRLFRFLDLQRNALTVYIYFLTLLRNNVTYIGRDLLKFTEWNYRYFNIHNHGRIKMCSCHGGVEWNAPLSLLLLLLTRMTCFFSCHCLVSFLYIYICIYIHVAYKYIFFFFLSLLNVGKNVELV
uniref:Uncharacterized protein TCIL3000_8_3350 n=1 Tax=Trypanosoma congolense (strain IL3000) TaxID=1068625 RepID=G0URV4_TRYCI|nr:unnamed protein product [Trypanosoma congolense IL3000]